ncbi:DUF1203 domain-containing protein [Salinicola aestuarinus]|uniref:DUF1203 domain-containing protein n=1 Tax=Salinicola aestuarinus TaxID=1949082 RepID=UPI000DA1F262|nr:DUF1203 domain-containing protein [Salinicola aestuarinus]
MSFRFVGIDAQSIDFDHLAGRGLATRFPVTPEANLPCRATLNDAEPGSPVWLVHFRHHAVASPYRAAGPIFITQGATRGIYRHGEVPPSLAKRSLALRAFDAAGFLTVATLCQRHDVATPIETLLEDARIDYLHFHYAAPGCFACRVERE